MKGCSYCGDHLTDNHQPEGSIQVLAAFLMHARKQARLSIREVCMKAKTSSYAGIEAGAVENPSPRDLYHIASALGVKYETLLNKSGIVAKRRAQDEFTGLFLDVNKWQRETFGAEADPVPAIAHLQREVLELAEHPESDEEYADALMLTVGAWMRRGKTPNELLDAVRRKLEINKAREWGKPDEDGVVEHIRTGGDP